MTELERFRRQKDEFFRTSPQSPIEDEDFAGLKYFPESPDYIFEAEVENMPGREVVQLETSTGDAEPYVRCGRARFEVGGRPQELTLFAAAYEGEPDSYFIPFRDATSGDETYGSGRYLEAPVRTGGRVTLDFNYAYNPYCAYSPHWRCPLPPVENRLSARIRAGEKRYL